MDWKENASGTVLWSCWFFRRLPWFNVWCFCFSSKQDFTWQINIWSQLSLTLEVLKAIEKLGLCQFFRFTLAAQRKSGHQITCFRALEKCWKFSSSCMSLFASTLSISFVLSFTKILLMHKICIEKYTNIKYIAQWIAHIHSFFSTNAYYTSYNNCKDKWDNDFALRILYCDWGEKTHI